MSATSGRNLKIRKNNVVLAGVRTKTVSIAGAPVDITSDDDLGFRKLLNNAGTYTVDLSVEGITKDETLLDVIGAAGSLMLTDISILFPDNSTMTGNFFLASVEQTGEYADAVTFSASLQSSGALTYTAA